MLSRTTRKELQAVRDVLMRRLNAINQILAEDAGFPHQSAPDAGNGHFAEFGLREAARKVLEEAAPRGLKPKLVAERMEQLGFRGTTEATTSLVTRVRNELWRMAKKGELRSARGVYSIGREAG